MPRLTLGKSVHGRWFVYNPWLAFTFKVFQLGLDAQSVIALRMGRLAAGGARSQAEASRMVVEKTAAFASMAVERVANVLRNMAREPKVAALLILDASPGSAFWRIAAETCHSGKTNERGMSALAPERPADFLPLGPLVMP